MDEQTKKRRTVWLVIGWGVVAIIGAYAIVKLNPNKSRAGSADLESIIESRETWNVSFASWSGKDAPDFVVRDLEGAEHRLSDYRGIDVLVVLWATWCPACNMEIPHLIELRDMFGPDELAILAISNEPAEHLKHFADSRGINYSIVSLGGSRLSSPFADVRAIPTTFFIDRNGAIKLAAEGLVSLEELKAILHAER
ncbi:MAG: peroxiredoxin family protein [Planctomycetota bacterium]|jgi:peroxiredoxin